MTSKRSLQTYGARIAKVVFSFSLILSAISWGAPNYGQLERNLHGKSDEEVYQTLKGMADRGELDDDPELTRALNQAEHGDAKYLRAHLELRALAERGTRKGEDAATTATTLRDPSKVASEIRQHPIYRDQGVKQQSNWLASAFERLQNFRPMSCKAPESDLNPPNMSFAWITYVMWGLLAVVVGLFLFFTLRHFQWLNSLERRAKALLDDDEPERTVDEWLALADELEMQGKNREAVRCLYLACLLRIDEARIARFDRGQTNWEHLHRIENSPRKPAGLEFRPATKAFDLIWYGMRPAGTEDVARFRQWYGDVLASVRAVAA
jgi:hypothetical protein